ncbi:MAG: tripartite tricarboxylate transporter TctB family protein [candidate division NC10 bacterium]|nr:tripartite tricarboxylate transporter TctB family protein [candidate division NC10 bacterium]
MRRADQITAIVLFVGSLVLMRESRKLPPSGTFGPGPEFLPFWLGILMAALAVTLFLQARRRAPAAEARVFPRLRALLPIGATLAGLAAYISLVEILGFLLATGLLTAFLLGVVERERWAVTLVVAVANSVILQTVFRTLLGVSLPKGFLGF